MLVTSGSNTINAKLIEMTLWWSYYFLFALIREND